MAWLAGEGPFINPKVAEKKLVEQFGLPVITISARYFGKPEGFSNPPELEAAPQDKRCERFFCRVRHRAVGLLVKIKDDGSVSGLPDAQLEISRVTATATVQFAGRTHQLSVN